MLDLSATAWRWVILSERHDLCCLVDAEDYDWLIRWRWNYGWHRNTPWKYYAKRNVGAARSTIYLHREVLVRAEPDQAELAATHHGDHINGNSLDNRRVNLRWLSPPANRLHRLARKNVPTLDQIVRGLLVDHRPAEDIPFVA